jgi:transposase
MDLRKRAVACYESGAATIASVAAQFQMGVATLGRLLALKRKTGSLEPKPHRGGQPPKLTESDRELLKALVKEQPDLTLSAYSEALEQLIHKRIPIQVTSRALMQMGYSTKKNSTSHRTRLRASSTGTKNVSRVNRSI